VIAAAGGSIVSRGAAFVPPGSQRASHAQRAFAARYFLKRLRATPARFRAGKGRGTTLRFWFSAPGRLQFTILSAAPECRKLGTFSRKVHRGVNRIRFLGRVRGRFLKPGTYTIVPEYVRGAKRRALGHVTVLILPSNRRLARAQAAVPLKLECRAAAAGGADVGAGGSSPANLASTPVDGSRSAPQAAPEATGRVASARKTVGGDAKRGDRLGDLPLVSAIIPDDAPVPPLVLAVVALAVIGLGSLALIGFVLRYVRGTWVP
jgi:hypothetical protein